MLPIIFSGHSGEVTQTLRDFVTKKFQRLQKHADNITSIHVFFNINKLLQIAEATVHIPGFELFASAESEDMYKAVDLLVDKLIRQIDKHKKR
jgi:putative sigma-54 modulation protein